MRSYVAYNHGDLDFELAPLSPAPSIPPSGCTTEAETISSDYQPCDLSEIGCWQKTYFAAPELWGNLLNWIFVSHIELGNYVLDLNGDGLSDSIAATNNLGTPVSWAGVNDGWGGYVAADDWTFPYRRSESICLRSGRR